MNKLVFLLSLSLVFFSCKKNSECTFKPPTTVAPASEITALQDYITAKGLSGSVTQHPNGFFYKIESEGSGATPSVCSNITVTYEGKLTNETKFDESTTGVSFVLGQLIRGWQLGIPLIKKGGSITLYLPPSLGYGSSANGSIPANSILIFEVGLVDVN